MACEVILADAKSRNRDYESTALTAELRGRLVIIPTLGLCGGGFEITAIVIARPMIEQNTASGAFERYADPP